MSDKLRLRDYDDGQFESLHAPGSMVVTASGVPNLFGCGFASAYSYALHLNGEVPMPDVGSEMTRRGNYLEPVLFKMFEDEHGRHVRQVKAYADHPELEGLSASPDGVEVVDKADVGPAEAKVVNQVSFAEQWNGLPPLRVMLQHQTQLACTGAAAGPILAWELGTFRSRLHHWDIGCHQGTVERILEETDSFLKRLRDGKTPDPDFTLAADRDAMRRLLNEIDDEMTVDLPGMSGDLDIYTAAKAEEKSAKNRASEAQAKIQHAMGEAAVAMIGEFMVKAPMRERAGYTVDPTNYRDFRVKKRRDS